ncbi:hypothetical protein [Pseudalgibacter alginicilyticus]|uniref:hypothetical protein n=1 Tax=Pseudalgibacter alginicilyticus TaxID=1736674 RepID=UPI0012FE6DF3|nr:hypothetical protein [Pseudalgibacter alginicilyticus]
MKETLKIALITILIYNCSDSKKKNINVSETYSDSIFENGITIDNRVLHVYDIEKAIRTENYELTIEQSHSSTNYH